MDIVDKHTAAKLATALGSPGYQRDAQAVLDRWIIEQVTFEDEAKLILAPFMPLDPPARRHTVTPSPSGCPPAQPPAYLPPPATPE